MKIGATFSQTLQSPLKLQEKLTVTRRKRWRSCHYYL